LAQSRPTPISKEKNLQNKREKELNLSNSIFINCIKRGSEPRTQTKTEGGAQPPTLEKDIKLKGLLFTREGCTNGKKSRLNAVVSPSKLGEKFRRAWGINKREATVSNLSLIQKVNLSEIRKFKRKRKGGYFICNFGERVEGFYSLFKKEKRETSLR